MRHGGLNFYASGLARRYAGPGGACAVLRAGEVLVRRAWGFADAERGVAFTPASLFRMCSVTKQFTCALVLDLLDGAGGDVGALDGDVAGRLPRLACAPPRALHLCHNQSGLRDYWAVAMLHGAAAEGPFGPAEAARVIGGARSLQFEPGTRYSYCNQNFRLLSDIVEARTGESFADRLRARIFAPAGMGSAFLAADTAAMPDGTTGYEGTPASGFRPAVNRVIWTGDAGLGASLDDMIAWERHIDETRDDPGGLHTRLSGPVSFADGRPAAYGFGLHRSVVSGRAATGHGGALRGWRCHRLHVASERLSVVVMFNHMADAHAAAVALAGAALGQAPAAARMRAAPAWLGRYVDPETRLAVRVEAAHGGGVRLRHGGAPPEVLAMADDGSAVLAGTRLVWRAGALWLERAPADQAVALRPCAGPPSLAIVGCYQCDELDATLHVIDAGGVLYGGVAGFLGAGRMEMLDHVGGDLWSLPCPRALDHAPPGEWTLDFGDGRDGVAGEVTVGCTIARRLTYRRV